MVHMNAAREQDSSQYLLLSCSLQIDIEYFPYDKQSCSMKFGGWSYNGFLLDVRQLPSRPTDVIETRYDEKGKEYQLLEQGMDLSAFYPSLEWDLISLTSMRHEQLYPGCCGQEFYIDISFDILLRRKTLFYTVNLVIPCMLIAILTTFVFYIPGKEHKVTFSISILVTLTVFYLVLIELIPPTSLVIPLIGKYLLFTMFLVSASILLSVLTLNYYRRYGDQLQFSSIESLLHVYRPGDRWRGEVITAGTTPRHASRSHSTYDR
uniref:Nicotinic acetylcholine receptor alpha subunit 8 n=1 Tax=Parascaris univalens TaxID=6257 RepID=A0A914ZGI1_PARUN